LGIPIFLASWYHGATNKRGGDTMSKEQCIRAMVSAAKSYSWLIHNSINIAISIDMDMDTCAKIIKQWADIRNTIVIELIELGYCAV